MLKYIQTQVPIPLFKRLKVEALERNITLHELLQEILTQWFTTKEETLKKEALQHGSKKTEKRSVRTSLS